MSTHKQFDKICCVVLALTLVCTVLFMNGAQFGLQAASTTMGYEAKLFDSSCVHTIDIQMENWEEFTATCESEAYSPCTVVIDDAVYDNVAIRGKGNTSLTQVADYGNNRYSFKIEFDHYDASNTYYGLDKLCLNNIIQDNTYMKDYLTYQMMHETGVAAPLCSYVYITVNGEDWGLYLAVEGVEEAFLQRNYGRDYGQLYKPDSTQMGGGRGNGEKFELDAFLDGAQSEQLENGDDQRSSAMEQMPDEAPGVPPMQGGQQRPEDGEDQTHEAMPSPDVGESNAPNAMTPPDGMEPPEGTQMPENSDVPASATGDAMHTGSADVLLQYIDDAAESYANIFDNAKTPVTDSDKTRLIQSLEKLSQGQSLAQVVDIETVIRYFVVHNFVLNFDSYTGSMAHNYYLYEKDGQLQMIPWDYNLAFGGFQSMSSATSLVNMPIDSPVSDGSIADRPMLAWIFADETYTQLYHTYFSEFIATWFEDGDFIEWIDTLYAMLAPYVQKDPTKFCTDEEFEQGVATLKDFCLLRAESVRAQLDGTIGKTADTQQSDTLIDASALQIDTMGTMHASMGEEKKRPTEPTSANPF